MNLGNNTNNRVESHNSKIKGVLCNSDELHVALQYMLFLSVSRHMNALLTTLQQHKVICASSGTTASVLGSRRQ